MNDSKALQVVLEELDALERSVLTLENAIAVLKIEIASIEANIDAIKANINEMKQTAERMLKKSIQNNYTKKPSINIAFSVTKDIRIEFPLPISLSRQ